jgi:hypothetical protein
MIARKRRLAMAREPAIGPAIQAAERCAGVAVGEDLGVWVAEGV